MSSMRPASAKIISHSEGMGTPSPDLVRQRAEEIAVINGHRHYTEEDWRQARLELHGGHDHSLNGDRDNIAWVSEGDMLASDIGHHVPRLEMEDDGSVVEELIAEGMDEAVHEQMLAAQMEVLAAGEGDEEDEEYAQEADDSEQSADSIED
jgi:hypothetical protein